MKKMTPNKIKTFLMHHDIDVDSVLSRIYQALVQKSENGAVRRFTIVSTAHDEFEEFTRDLCRKMQKQLDDE